LKNTPSTIKIVNHITINLDQKKNTLQNNMDRINKVGENCNTRLLYK